VGHEQRVRPAAQRPGQRDLVGDHHAGVHVVAQRGQLGGRESADERRHGVEAGPREFGEQVAVGERGVREPVHAQGERTLTGLQVFEGDAVGGDPAPPEFGHLDLLVVFVGHDGA